jgi:hypothetical protein
MTLLVLGGALIGTENPIEIVCKPDTNDVITE